MSNPLAIVLHALGQATAPGTGPTVDTLPVAGAPREVARLKLEVQSVAVGTTNLALFVETSDDQSIWRLVGSATIVPAQANSTSDLLVEGLRRYVRARWTLAGSSPAVTWGLSGNAEVVYCLPADITRYAVPERSIAEIDAASRIDACIAASSEADGYFGGAYDLPLLAWDDATRQVVARVAANTLFAKRGVDPNGADAGVLLGYDRSISWLKRIEDGHLKPPGIIDSTPDTFEAGAVVASTKSRGWKGGGAF